MQKRSNQSRMVNDGARNTLDRAITRMIADRVRRRRESLAQISRCTGISPTYLARLARAAGIRYKHQHASPEQIAAAVRSVVEEGLTFRASARRHAMSKTAVHRFVQKRRRKHIDSAGPVRFSQHRWRCPIHGQINVYPCVACMAAQSRA